jgi:hypothetical protein
MQETRNRTRRRRDELSAEVMRFLEESKERFSGSRGIFKETTGPLRHGPYRSTLLASAVCGG